MKGAHEAEVALVSEGSDDKSRRSTQVLKAVKMFGTCHAHHTVIYVVFPVVPQLLHPFKVLAENFDIVLERALKIQWKPLNSEVPVLSTG